MLCFSGNDVVRLQQQSQTIRLSTEYLILAQFNTVITRETLAYTFMFYFTFFSVKRCGICLYVCMYTVNCKKGGNTFVIITLENVDGY